MEALSDMRVLIESLEDRDDLVRIKKRVSAKYELAAIVKKIQDSSGQAVLFEDVDGKMRAAANLYGGRDKIGNVFGVAPEETASTLARRGAGPLLKPVVLSERPERESP